MSAPQRCEQPTRAGAPCPRPARFYVHLKLARAASPHDTEQRTPSGRFVAAGGRSLSVCGGHLGPAVDRLTAEYAEYRGSFVPEVRTTYGEPMTTAPAAAPSPVHKAAPGPRDYHCGVCGQEIKSVPGGSGPVWVHADSGAVAAGMIWTPYATDATAGH